MGDRVSDSNLNLPDEEGTWVKDPETNEWVRVDSLKAVWPPKVESR